MIETEQRVLRAPLTRRNGALRMMARFGVAAMVFVIVLNLFAFGSILLSPSLGTQVSGVNALVLLFWAVRSVFTFVMYVVLAFFFRDLASDDSPFSGMQARRLRLVAAILLVDAAFGLVAIPGATPLVAGMVQLPVPVVTFDIRPIVISALLFVVSYVFEYGERLQSDSDEIA